MTNVLVTGGAGYIGSHACKALKAAGFTPVTYDNLVTGWQDAVKFGPFEQGDLMAAACGFGGEGETGWAGTHHGEVLLLRDRREHQFGLVAGTRVH